MYRKNCLDPNFSLQILLIIILNFQLSGLKGQSYLPDKAIKEIETLRKENRLDEALLRIDEQIATAESQKQANTVIDARLLKADYLRMKGYNAGAKAIIDSIGSIHYALLKRDALLHARFFIVKATLHLTEGDLKQGRSAIEEAIEIYTRELGAEDSLLAPCFNKLGNYYFHSRNYDSAMACYTRALALSEKKKNFGEDRASYLQNIGIIHLEQGNFNKAEDNFIESLSIKEFLLPANSSSLGRIYLNIGKFYQMISDLENSFTYLGKAEKIFSGTEVLPNLELGKIYWNKGLIYYLTGDYDLALTYLFNAKKIIESVFKDNGSLLKALHSDIANIYTYTGEFRKAILYYQLSLNEDGGVINIKTYRNLAQLHSNDGNQRKAREYYNKAFKTLASLQANKINSLETALTFMQYGEFLYDIGNDSSLYFFNRAYDMFLRERGFSNRDVAASLYNKGDYYYRKGQLDLAMKYNHESLLSISGSPIDMNYFYNPPIQSFSSYNLIIKILNQKALFFNEYFRIHSDTTFLLASGNTYLRSLDIIDQVKMNYRAEDCQAILSSDIFEIYENAIGQFIGIYDITGNKEWLAHAFKTSERGKSVALLNKLKEAEAKKIGLLPEDLGLLEKNIISNVNLYRNNISREEDEAEPDIKKIQYLHANLLVYEKKYDSLIGQFQQYYPEYYKLKYEHQVVSVDQLKQSLDTNEMLLEYTLAKSFLAIFYISHNDFLVKKIAIDSLLIKDIFTLRDNLDFDHVREYTYKDYQVFLGASHRLYQLLIKPFGDRLHSDQKLIIVPDGELSYLSFESLIENPIPSDTVAFRNLPYLLKKCTITYSSSSTIYSILKKGERPSLRKGVLAMAPSTNIFTRSIIAKNEALMKILGNDKDLPGTVWEAEAILKIMQGKKLVGDEATEAAFKQLSKDYDILHFATHTRIDDRNPLSSMLSFFPYDISEEDGTLYTYEIYNLNLKGELAVLSACSTGDGKLEKGEGVISLARAFSYAGMPSVMMTLWNVEDISTGNIIPIFYHLLEKGFDKDVALQAAKLNYLKKTKREIETHPAFWSGLVLYGNNRGFRPPIARIYFILLVALVGLTILISFVLLRRYRRYRLELNTTELDLSNKIRTEGRL